MKESFQKQWNHWWFREADPHGIALFRIIFGLYLLLYFGLRLPHVPMLFSELGLVIPFDLYLPENLRFILAPPSVEVAYLLFSLLILSLISFTIGAYTRISAMIALLFFIYYVFLAFHMMGGPTYNRLFPLFLLFFTFSDAGNAFSYDMWKKHGSFKAWEPASILTQRLITIQVTATYLGVSFQKIWLPDWQGGELLYYSFQGMWSQPLAWWFVQQDVSMYIYDAMVFIVKVFQVAWPFGLWFRKLRPWFILGGFLFHFGVSFFLSAIWWFYALVATYYLFYEPEEIARRIKQWTH
jgi:hypothetical protein